MDITPYILAQKTKYMVIQKKDDRWREEKSMVKRK
jgi:hypothetical protein